MYVICSCKILLLYGYHPSRLAHGGVPVCTKLILERDTQVLQGLSLRDGLTLDPQPWFGRPVSVPKHDEFYLFNSQPKAHA